MNSISFRNSKSNLLQFNQSKIESSTKMLNVSKGSEVLCKTMKKLKSFVSPTRKFTSKLEPRKTEKKRFAKHSEGFDNPVSDRKNKISAYFQTIRIHDVDDAQVDQQLLEEFFNVKLMASALVPLSKNLDTVSESFEVVELNNRSIHLSKLCNSQIPNSVGNSKVFESEAPSKTYTNFRGETSQSNDMPDLAEKLKELYSKLQNRQIGIESKQKCIYHLEKISQILDEENKANNISDVLPQLPDKQDFAHRLRHENILKMV